MDQHSARQLLERVDYQAARAMVLKVAQEIDGLAAQVWAFGAAEGARRAVAIVAQMGAELAVGACQLYEADRWYAGAALVRQIVEVEYLLFLFATDVDEPARWLGASPEDARKTFAPGAMRKRSGGRFDQREYAAHCESGGHPRVRGHVLLKEHHTLTSVKPLQLLDLHVKWVDLAQHVERMWRNYVAAVELHSPTNVYLDRFGQIEQVISHWHSTDREVPRI